MSSVRHVTRRRKWSVAALMAVTLVAGLWIISAAGTALIVEYPLSDPDAIISLGSHEWERLPEAARVARASPSALVLLTEPAVVTEHNCHDCANRVARLVAMGVGEDRIRMLEIVGAGTHGEAQAARLFAEQQGVRRLLVVTSPYHTRRSLGVFRKVFGGQGVAIGVRPAPVDPPIQAGRWLLAPYDRAYVPYEWAGTLYYWWKYGVPLRQAP